MAERETKILIIGNGFDLAHGLPTAYKDFMQFCNVVPSDLLKNIEHNDVIKRDVITKWNIHSEIKAIIESALDDTSVLEKEIMPMIQELNDCIEENIWYEYFRKIEEKMKGDNWIDFESEISDVIEYVDGKIDRLEKKYKRSDFVKNEVEDLLGKNNKFFTIIFPGQQSTLSGREMRERCFNDLEKLTRALEIYLSVFVEKIPCDKMDIITRIQPDYVMNFNYTNTYERTYSINEEKPKVFHVHGECNAGKTMEDNNMVLGIDEYLKDERKDIHTNFSIFKKFVQRIRKRNGA